MAEGVQERVAAILSAVRRIPPGNVASYGQIADLAGLPRRARLVGRVLRETDCELPWHRVVRADGRVAFPVGHPNHQEQIDRLRQEGVPVRKGRIDLAACGMGIDALLWGPGALS